MDRIRVLFLCAGNSARSIIAEALLRQMGGHQFDVHSAGTHPKGLNPLTLRLLREERADAAGLRSKQLEGYDAESFDYVITVCDQAAEECPFYPGANQRLHWSFPDPAAVEGSDEARLAAFREVARGMRARLQSFIPAAARARTQAEA